MTRLVQVKSNGTVTQITTFYKCCEQKSISENRETNAQQYQKITFTSVGEEQESEATMHTGSQKLDKDC